MNTRKGFTLVELLVVIAILAILATVSVVGYTSFIERADQSNADVEANQIKTIVTSALMGANDCVVLVKDTAADGETANGIYVTKGTDGKYVVSASQPESVTNPFDATADITALLATTPAGKTLTADTTKAELVYKYDANTSSTITLNK